MNLLINFIAPQEVRSASIVSAKSLLQISAILIPAILVLVIFLAYIGYAEKSSALELQEGTWAKTEVRLNRANELNQSLQARKQALGELTGWQQARMNWHEALDGIRASVPESVQIKVLQARQSLEVGENGHARRVLRMIISGRCEGPEAEATVERFRAALESDAPLGSLVQEARVAGFREDMEAGSSPDDRAFQIEVDFIPRSLHATAAE